MSHDYLQDFDWQVNYVLSSSTLSHKPMPLMQLQLRIRKAGGECLEETNRLELTSSDLDSTIATLAGAGNALRELASSAKP